MDVEMLGQLGNGAVALDGALKAAEWFRRGRLLMVSPVHGDYRRCQAETPLIALFKFAEPALMTAIMAKASIDE